MGFFWHPSSYLSKLFGQGEIENNQGVLFEAL